MLHILAHYFVNIITRLTFGFTLEINSRLQGESPEFVWHIHLHSRPPYVDFIAIYTMVVASSITYCHHPVHITLLRRVPLCFSVWCRGPLTKRWYLIGLVVACCMRNSRHLARIILLWRVPLCVCVKDQDTLTNDGIWRVSRENMLTIQVFTSLATTVRRAASEKHWFFFSLRETALYSVFSGLNYWVRLFWKGWDLRIIWLLAKTS